MNEKTCPQCHKTKHIDGFGLVKRRRPSGNVLVNVHSWCIDCRRIKAKEAAERKRKTPEGLAAYRDARARHRQRIGGRKAERDRSKVVFEGKTMTHAEMIAIKRQRCEQKAADAERQKVERAAKREQKLREKIKQKPWTDPTITSAEKFKIRYRLDPEFNIKERLRASMRRKRQGHKMGDLIRAAMKRNGSSPKFESFAGYSVAELKAHLERQFTKGMTWEKFNAGEIHIDHIVPVTAFDLSDVDQLRDAWQITNLRPLWAKENIQKSNKRQFLI